MVGEVIDSSIVVVCLRVQVALLLDFLHNFVDTLFLSLRDTLEHITPSSGSTCKEA